MYGIFTELDRVKPLIMTNRLHVAFKIKKYLNKELRDFCDKDFKIKPVTRYDTDLLNSVYVSSLEELLTKTVHITLTYEGPLIRRLINLSVDNASPRTVKVENRTIEISARFLEVEHAVCDDNIQKLAHDITYTRIFSEYTEESLGKIKHNYSIRMLNYERQE